MRINVRWNTEWHAYWATSDFCSLSATGDTRQIAIERIYSQVEKFVGLADRSDILRQIYLLTVIENGPYNGMNTPIPIFVAPSDKYVIFVKYSDDISGRIDLSDMADTELVHGRWEDEAFWNSVHVNKDFYSIAWDSDPALSDYIDLCPDSLYMELTNIDAKALMPTLRKNRLEGGYTNEPTD